MKHIISFTIVIFIFCLNGFAQTGKNPCQKIIINTFGRVDPGQPIMASASFEKENQPSTSKFNWTVIKGDELVKINNVGNIEVDTKDYKADSQIIILASASDEKCRNTAMAKISVVPACWLPPKIDQYGNISWSDQKARLEYFAIRISKEDNKISEGIIYLYFDEKSPANLTTNRLRNIYNHLFITRKFDKNLFTFVISKDYGDDLTEFMIYPQEFISDLDKICMDCLVIKAENIEKLESLFQSKTIAKTRKK